MRNFVLVALVAALTASLPATASEVALGSGKVLVKQYPGGVTVHAFMTGDAMNDVASLVETRNGLVAIEAPAFRADISAWKGYIASLKKPLSAVLVSNHPSNGGWYGNAPVYATDTAKAAIQSGRTKSVIEGVKKGFGDKFESDIAVVGRRLDLGRTTFDGVAYEIRPDGAGYAIVLPEQKIVFQHMMGGDTHSIIGGPAHADFMVKQLSQYQAEGIREIYSTHHAPETADALARKIAYVQDVKAAASKASDKDAFIAAVKAKYPALQGEKFLKMTAGQFFPAKKQ